jgi:hypothetical protein
MIKLTRLLTICTLLVSVTGAAAAQGTNATPKKAAPAKLEEKASTQDGLIGRAWEGTNEVPRSPDNLFIFEFRPGGIVHYYSNSSDASNGTWVQKGRVITFEMNGHFVDYEGTIDANAMKGTAHNKNGENWTWSVSTDPHFVILPQDIHCLLHDSTTSFLFKNGNLKAQLSSVKAITCQINGPEKDVPLVGIQPDGTVLTKDFGRLKITMGNRVDPGTLRGSIIFEFIEIEIGKLKSFREYLQGE